MDTDPISASACGGEKPAVLNTSTGSIFSPGYNQSTYPNNALCHWLIRVPAGKVSIFAAVSIKTMFLHKWH